MADFNWAVALAKELIGNNGRMIGLYRIDATAADPTKPWRGSAGAETALNSNIAACFVPVAGSELGTDFIDKELLKNCSEVCLVPGSQDGYETATHIRDNGVDYAVNWCKALRPAEQFILMAYGISR